MTKTNKRVFYLPDSTDSIKTFNISYNSKELINNISDITKSGVGDILLVKSLTPYTRQTKKEAVEVTEISFHNLYNYLLSSKQNVEEEKLSNYLGSYMKCFTLEEEGIYHYSDEYNAQLREVDNNKTKYTDAAYYAYLRDLVHMYSGEEFFLSQKSALENERVLTRVKQTESGPVKILRK